MRNIVIALFVIVLFASCEEKMVIIPEFTPVESGRVILVEELTGVRCPNCPTGSERLKAVESLYPDNMVVVAVHGVDLAKPLDESAYDFRNEDAAAIENYLKPYLGKPAAYFNRVVFEDLLPDFGNSFSGGWQDYVERELEKEQQINLAINHEFDPITRELEITVNAIPLEDMQGEFKMNIMMTESHIIDAQDNQSTIELDYEHNHVLRDMITQFDGDFLTNELTESVLASKSYTYTVPTDEQGLWVPENLEIVAFISNTEGELKEVIQAAKAHLVE